MNEVSTRTTGYSPARKAVHWTVLVLCIAQFPTGWAIANSHLGHLSLTQSAWSVFVHRSHALAGGMVVLLVAVGIVLRLVQGRVLQREHATRWQMRYAVNIAHLLICGLLLALSVTGFIAMYYSRTAAPLHTVLIYVGLALVGLHAGAALWHQFVIRDGTITRMLPRLKSMS